MHEQKTWDSLTAEDQSIVLAAGKASAETERKLWKEREKKSMETVIAGGTVVNQIADKAPFQAAMAAVYDRFLVANPELTDLVNMMRNAE